LTEADADSVCAAVEAVQMGATKTRIIFFMSDLVPPSTPKQAKRADP